MVAFSGFDLTRHAQDMDVDEARTILDEALAAQKIRTGTGRIQAEMTGQTQLRLAATGGSGYVYPSDHPTHPGEHVRYDEDDEEDMRIRTAMWVLSKAQAGVNGNGAPTAARSRSNPYSPVSSGFKIGSIVITDKEVTTLNALRNMVNAQVNDETKKWFDDREKREAARKNAAMQDAMNKVLGAGFTREEALAFFSQSLPATMTDEEAAPEEAEEEKEAKAAKK